MSVSKRFRQLFHRADLDREIDEELQSHIVMRAADNVAEGMTPEAARRDALLKFGNPTATRESIAGIDTVLGLENFLRDLRYALRQLRKSPGFAITAIVTLALGIGATTAIYTLINQALLRALPVRNPQRLVQLNGSGAWEGHTDTFAGDASNYFSYPMYQRLRDQNQVFSGMLATTPAQVGILWRNHSELANAELVSGNYFDVLGVRPALGRLLLPSDNRVKNGSPVVVLSFAYWQRHLGADPHVVGKTVGVNGHPFTIVGVAAPGFHSVIGGMTPAFFTPMVMKPEVESGVGLDFERGRWLNIIARLKPGMTRAKAQAGIQPLWHALRAAELQNIENHSAHFRVAYLDKSFLTLRDGSRGFSPEDADIRTPFFIVLFMTVFVLLMACANVAGLMLVRSAGRVREMSVRYALGARRGQILQQLLMEGVLLGVVGGALGLWLAPHLATLLERRVLDHMTGELPFSTHPDWQMLAFAVVLSIGVSLLFSMAPALQFWKPDVAPALKQQAATTVSGGSLRLQRIAVGMQIGLSVLLLLAAGLFVRTLYNLKSIDVGFQTDHLIQFGVNPYLAGYSFNAMMPLYQQMLTTLRNLPGVRAVGATDDPELANNNTDAYVAVAGYKPAEGEAWVENAKVFPGYFSALGVRLLAGRTFTDADSADAAKVAIVNKNVAQHYFGDPRNALGHYMGIGHLNHIKTDMQIVGVVQDTKHDNVNDPMILPSVFIPYAQDKFPSPMSFYVCTRQAPGAATAMIRESMHKLDPKLVLSSLETMDDQINDDLHTQRVVALLAISFGILALLISAIGLYAVLSYATAQRTREIGLRIALGANRTSIASIVLLDVLRLVAISVAIAFPAAWLLARWVRSQLYGVSGHDPLTMAVVIVSVAVIALLAALLPVRRAISVDPMQALRSE